MQLRIIRLYFMADSSNGQDKRLSISKCWVQLPHPSPGDRRPMAGRQIVALKMRIRFPPITPHMGKYA